MKLFRINYLSYGGKRYTSFYSAENVLNEENIKRTVSKFTSMTPIRLQIEEPSKKAAVLIPLCVVNSKVSLLYTLRAPHLKSHRGQVSFPGGMLEQKDKSLECTALRETKEELGLDENKIKIWGCGKLIVARGETCVLPVIGEIKSTLDFRLLKINANEVEEAFTVPLEDLCNPHKLRYTQFKNGYSIPVFLGGPRRIWGLTAVITNMFLRALLPSNAYSHRIMYVKFPDSYNRSQNI